MIMCTVHLDPCLWSDPLLMQAAFEDNNLPLNTLVHGFVLVNVLYGGNLSKIH